MHAVYLYLHCMVGYTVQVSVQAGACVVFVSDNDVYVPSTQSLQGTV